MQTVGDVIEFWKTYCEREGTLTQEEIYIGCDRIAEDADYWAGESMSKLRDRIWDESRKGSQSATNHSSQENQ